MGAECCAQEWIRHMSPTTGDFDYLNECGGQTSSMQRADFRLRVLTISLGNAWIHEQKFDQITSATSFGREKKPPCHFAWSICIAISKLLYAHTHIYIHIHLHIYVCAQIFMKATAAFQWCVLWFISSNSFWQGHNFQIFHWGCLPKSCWTEIGWRKLFINGDN